MCRSFSAMSWFSLLLLSRRARNFWTAFWNSTNSNILVNLLSVFSAFGLFFWSEFFSNRRFDLLAAAAAAAAAAV